MWNTSNIHQFKARNKATMDTINFSMWKLCFAFTKQIIYFLAWTKTLRQLLKWAPVVPCEVPKTMIACLRYWSHSDCIWAYGNSSRKQWFQEGSQEVTADSTKTMYSRKRCPWSVLFDRQCKFLAEGLTSPLPHWTLQEQLGERWPGLELVVEWEEDNAPEGKEKRQQVNMAAVDQTTGPPS